jgi:hypothetical protein
MKLGTETGSVINNMYSRMLNGAPEPEIGMGATVLLWSDRHAATVVEWDPKRKIVTVTEDIAKVVKGSTIDGSAEYEYETNPDGPIASYRLEDRGWVQVRFNEETKRWNKVGSGPGLIVGKRDEYRDPSF